MAEESVQDNAWNNAIIFHEIKKRIKNKQEREKAKDIAIKAVLKKAEKIVGSVSRPYTYSIESWKDYPNEELSIEESLEEDPFLQELSVERKKEVETEVILCLDTSLSMTGEKMALLAVSIAAISFELKAENFSIINFESNANLIKPLGSSSSAYEMVRDFLNSPAQGLTNMEDALKLAISEWDRGKTSRRHVILMSDGKYTAGDNPKYLAQYLPKLHIVQIGKSWAKNRFYQSLASAGGGEFLRVSNFESLPKKLYTLVYRMIR